MFQCHMSKGQDTWNKRKLHAMKIKLKVMTYAWYEDREGKYVRDVSLACILRGLDVEVSIT